MRLVCLYPDRDVRYGEAVRPTELARALAAEGAEVLVLIGAIDPGAAPPAGVTVEYLPAPTERGPWLVERLAGFGARALYERLGAGGADGAHAADALGIPHLAELAAPLPEGAAAHQSLSSADLVFALSPPLAAYAQTHAARTVELAPNAAAVERFPAPLANPPGDRLVVALGGPMRQCHGPETIATAWRMLGPDAPELVVAGDVAPSAVRATLGGADIALVPAAADAPSHDSPLMLFDSLAAGVPVIAADLPGVASIVDARTGLLVAPGDAGALAEAVAALAADPERRAAMGAAGRALVAARHSWRHRARRILAAAAAPHLAVPAERPQLAA